MAKRRTGLRMHPVVEFLARLLMRQRGFATFTALIEQLIRDDWDKRATPQMQAELTAFIEREKAALKEQSPAPSVEPSVPAPSRTAKPKGTRGKNRSPEKASN